MGWRGSNNDRKHRVYCRDTIYIRSNVCYSLLLLVLLVLLMLLVLLSVLPVLPVLVLLVLPKQSEMKEETNGIKT